MRDNLEEPTHSAVFANTMAFQTPCPSHSDLRSSSRAPFVEEHLATCLRCRALVSRLSLTTTPDEAGEVASTGWFASGRNTPELGQLYFATTMATNERLGCVVVAVEDGAIDVVPLSDEVTLATHQDVRLPATLLGYETVAQTWNAGQVLVEQLAQPMGTLTDEQWSLLIDVLDGESTDSDQVGPTLDLADDPRWLYVSREAERAKPFYAPAQSLHGISRLPAFVCRRAEEVGVSIAELDERLAGMVPIDGPWVRALVDDQLSLAEDVPAAALVELLDALHTPPARAGLERLIVFTHADSQQQLSVDDHEAAVVFLRSDDDQQDHDDDRGDRVNQDARLYADEVLAALTDRWAARGR